MININNYKEVIKTSNGDGTDRVEIIGCKVTDREKEFEANIVFPRVSEIEQTALADYKQKENEEIFTIHIPD